MNEWVAEIVSREVADLIGPNWGYGSGTRGDPGPWEGELRNMWKPLRQEALWFHGGNLHLSRHYSLYVALQLKARMEGHPDAGLLMPADPEITLSRSPHTVSSRTHRSTQWCGADPGSRYRSS